MAHTAIGAAAPACARMRSITHHAASCASGVGGLVAHTDACARAAASRELMQCLKLFIDTPHTDATRPHYDFKHTPRKIHHVTVALG